MLAMANVLTCHVSMSVLLQEGYEEDIKLLSFAGKEGNEKGLAYEKPFKKSSSS